MLGADHGESWGERYADKADVQGVYHLHGAGLWDEILHVPLIVAAPGVGPAVVSSQVRTVDIAPTLLELAGLGPLGEADGASLLSLLDGRESGDRTALAMTSDRGVLSQIAVRRPPRRQRRQPKPHPGRGPGGSADRAGVAAEGAGGEGLLRRRPARRRPLAHQAPALDRAGLPARAALRLGVPRAARPARVARRLL